MSLSQSTFHWPYVVSRELLGGYWQRGHVGRHSDFGTLAGEGQVKSQAEGVVEEPLDMMA